MAARKYEVVTCPRHGMEQMYYDHCTVVIERHPTRRFAYCYEGESVTAYDSRDVDPLVEAARNAFARFGAMGTHDAKLAAALAPFDGEES